MKYYITEKNPTVHNNIFWQKKKREKNPVFNGRHTLIWRLTNSQFFMCGVVSNVN